MEFLAENWWYLLLVGGFAYMMFRGGGCCGGHSHGGHDHSGHGNMGHSGGNGQYGSGQMSNQIEMVRDPECGMTVNPDTAVKQRIDGKMYYFCSETCRGNFVRKQQGF